MRRFPSLQSYRAERVHCAKFGRSFDPAYNHIHTRRVEVHSYPTSVVLSVSMGQGLDVFRITVTDVSPSTHGRASVRQRLEQKSSLSQPYA